MTDRSHSHIDPKDPDFFYAELLREHLVLRHDAEPDEVWAGARSLHDRFHGREQGWTPPLDPLSASAPDKSDGAQKPLCYLCELPLSDHGKDGCHDARAVNRTSDGAQVRPWFRCNGCGKQRYNTDAPCPSCGEPDCTLVTPMSPDEAPDPRLAGGAEAIRDESPAQPSSDKETPETLSNADPNIRNGIPGDDSSDGHPDLERGAGDAPGEAVATVRHPAPASSADDASEDVKESRPGREFGFCDWCGKPCTYCKEPSVSAGHTAYTETKVAVGALIADLLDEASKTLISEEGCEEWIDRFISATSGHASDPAKTETYYDVEDHHTRSITAHDTLAEAEKWAEEHQPYYGSLLRITKVTREIIREVDGTSDTPETGAE